jgi:type IV/VI secretion system ImpK/VasF family protein
LQKDNSNKYIKLLDSIILQIWYSVRDTQGVHTMVTLQHEWTAKEIQNTSAYNPLIRSASTLLTIAYQLTEQTSKLNNQDILIQSLVKEMKSYYEQAHSLGYEAKNISTSRYWLCATIDYLIKKLPNPNKTKATSLLKELNYSTENDQFLSLLQEQQQAAKPSVDTLELAYLCLSLGYTPENMPAENDLKNINLELSKQIQQLRIEPKAHENKPLKLNKIVVITISIITIASLIGIHYDFKKKVQLFNTTTFTVNTPHQHQTKDSL